MAEILLSAIVSAIVGNLNSQALRELGTVEGLTSDLKNLEGTLSTIQAVLQDAEKKQQKSDAVKSWLKKLRGGAYDAENVVDEIFTQAAIFKLDRERGLKHRVRNFFSPRNKQLFWFKMAKKIKEVNENIDSIAKLRQFHLFPEEVEADNRVARQESSSLVVASEIVGRDYEKDKIINFLFTRLVKKDKDVLVFAIYGMSGLGKTTLAQMMYNDERMRSQFDLRIWICVSQDFDIRRFIKAILEFVDDEACDIQELDRLQLRLQQKMNEKKFLLVLDDVWNEDKSKWLALKDVLSCGARGSLIIVTTQILKIAKSMANLRIHYLQELSEDDSWSLFKHHAVGAHVMEDYMQTIGKAILTKCRGVPLALRALGSLMSLKDGEDEWRSVMESEMWDLQQNESSILSTLRLSYYNLAPHLRQCFTYACVFPKDHNIEGDSLIQLWVANGFISSRGPKKVHILGHEILSELVWRSFIQVVESEDHVTRYKIHHLLHDLASSIMKDDIFNTKTAMGLEIPAELRHLYIDGKSEPKQIVKAVDSRSLRSLFVENSHEVGELIPSLLKQKHLRVLDINGFDKQILDLVFLNLKHLRYLNLSFSGVDFLPESIIYLQNLQSLNLQSCVFLSSLPKGLKHLKSLIYLDIRGCDSLSLENMPPEMEQLKDLQILVEEFRVKIGNGCHIGNLKGLNLCGDLRLEQLENIKDSADSESANLKSQSKLHTLSLSWQFVIRESFPSDLDGVLDALQPHQNLKKLDVNYYLGRKFPDWMGDVHLKNLVQISLIGCTRCEYLPPLGKLLFLKELIVRGINSVRYFITEYDDDDKSQLFPALECLMIADMKNLESWMIGKNRFILPRLRDAAITDCPSLAALPHLPNLTKLTLNDFSTLQQRESLPENLKSLESLRIESCHNFDSLPRDALKGLSSLRTLYLFDCKKLVSLSEGVKHLTALQQLFIGECPEIRTLPEELQRLNSLRSLRIMKCEKLSSLPGCLGSLKCLSSLKIKSCSSLKSLPDGLHHSTSLKKLEIESCPELEGRCRSETGEDWPKISHIPYIWINLQHVQGLKSSFFTDS